MVYIKTKEGASLLVALLAAVIVAVTTTLLDVVWWMTLCAAAGVFVVMALVALFIIRKYVAYKLKPIYSIVLSRDVHTNEIFSELKDKHVENIGEELTAWADTNDKEIARLKETEQFRKQYGIVRNVSDRPYVSNSFHCHVTEDITPIQKQDLEGRFWELCNGGKIQYVKYPINYNKEAVKTLVRRAMDKGFYEGVNLSLAYCDDCGHEELEMDVCPVCGSKNLTKIDRMNGYLSYSRVHGDTRLNEAKMAEIAERKSM